MPISIVIGGQYGSEGKGKVAHHLARERSVRIAIRVGGSNSGHTSMGSPGKGVLLRHLPTAALEPDVICMLGAGSYVDPDVLMDEVDRIGLSDDRLLIDPNAIVVTAEDRAVERDSGLTSRIGSTGSGTGAAVVRRVQRRSAGDLASAFGALSRYVGQTQPLITDALAQGERVLIEGTQGFGLSVLHSPHYPHVTSRDTTAAGALSEVGLSPLDVDEVVMVLRAFPIRVAGASGPFDAEEIDWETVRFEGGHDRDLTEYTSVTKRLRRVARFDPRIVRAAVAANKPNRIVLNHVDHVDASAVEGMTRRAQEFVATVSAGIGRPVDMVGLGPGILVPAEPRLSLAASS